MFEQTFKNVDDVLRHEAGCTTELDYTEQSSWVLFLKYLDDLVPRVVHNVRYNRFSLTRASAVVKCQSALA